MLAKKRAVRPLARGLRLEPLEDRQLMAVVEMTDREQLLLELVNRARNDPKTEASRYSVNLNKDVPTDEQISTDPKQPLAPHQALIDAARFHSQEMLDEEFFAHVNPKNNNGPSDRAIAAGYPGGAGENIAWYGSRQTMYRDAEVYLRHRALFLSAEHRVNMMNEDYREIGTGIRFGVYDRVFSVMVTENFGARAGDHFLTGVAFSDKVYTDDFYTIGESLPNVVITATRIQDGKSYTTTTGPSGGYSLPVANGVYTITATGPGLPTPIVYAGVSMNGQNKKVDFNPLSYLVGKLSGVIYHDQNKDSKRDEGEPGLAGRAVYIDRNDDEKFTSDELSTITDDDGQFVFNGLYPGSYIVRQISPTGWAAPTGNDVWETSILAGKNNIKTRETVMASRATNDPPEANPDSGSVKSGVDVTLPIFDNDTDDVAIQRDKTKIVVQPQHGQVRWDATKSAWIYRSNDNFSGTDTFEYIAVDGGGLESDQVKVTLNVVATVAPVAQNDQVSVVTATNTVLDIFGNDRDSDGNLVLAQTKILAGPLHGALAWNASTSKYSYRSVDGYVGADSFTYSVIDNDGKESSAATVQITVTPVPNVVPVAVADQYTVEMDVETPLNVLLNDTDSDGTIDDTKLKVVTQPQHGTVTWNADSKRYVFKPTTAYLGADSFEYTVTDNSGGESVKARVSLTVAESVGTKWKNPTNALDVNNDTFVSSIDALLILNMLEAEGGHRLPPPVAGQTPPPYVDVNGDSSVSPQDALLVVNEINRIIAERANAASAGGGQGEGEQSLGDVTSDLAAAQVAIDSMNRANRQAELAAAVDSIWESFGTEADRLESLS